MRIEKRKFAREFWLKRYSVDIKQRFLGRNQLSRCSKDVIILKAWSNEDES